MRDIDKVLVEKEIHGCFDFLWNEANTNKDSKGYGLVRDISGRDIASLAAVGFALPAYAIGVLHGYISFEEAKERVVGTLNTVYMNVPQEKGFLAHFVDFNSCEMKKNSEYSTIDTAIFLMGAITAGEYFGGEAKELATMLSERVDWEGMVTIRDSKKMFLMAIFPNNPNFSVCWDHYAEQLMMYILYAGQSNSDELLARQLYYGFERNIGSYKGHNLIYMYSNPLFIHQFTHTFFDFKDYVDERGCDWWENSINATLANRQYCIDQKWSKTFNENSWGLTATQAEPGYRVYGAPPFGYINDCQMKVDGTVAPYAALSSMPFTPTESLSALEYFGSISDLWGKYGLKDSYNFEKKRWISDSYLGIDKGPTILMLENYLTGFVWKFFMQSDVAKRSIKVLKFQKREYDNYNR